MRGDFLTDDSSHHVVAKRSPITYSMLRTAMSAFKVLLKRVSAHARGDLEASVGRFLSVVMGYQGLDGF